MKKYQVLFIKSAAKEVRKFPSEIIKRIIEKSKELENDPRPIGCKKLSGETEDLWRIRTGDYRIVYAINDDILIVDIRRVGHRKDIYKK